MRRLEPHRSGPDSWKYSWVYSYWYSYGEAKALAHHEAVGSMAAVLGFVVSIRGGLAV